MNMDAKNLFSQVGLLLCNALLVIYDVLTLPVYFVIDQPWKHWKLRKIIWSKLEQKNDPYSSYVRQVYRPDTFPGGVHTMSELFERTVRQYGDKPCYGTREILGEEVENHDGKAIKKMSLGEYKWMTYNEAESRVAEVSKGLISIGVKSRKPVVILAETRVEWIITAHACFRINVPVVTLYGNLGDEGLIHGINETEVTHIITSAEVLPKLKKILHLTPAITNIVYMEASHPPETDGMPDGMQLKSFTELIENGRNLTDCSYEPPGPEDLAILMYTSGSTGVPKGVMICHKNLISTITGLTDVVSPSALETAKKSNMYIAYLPLAHVLELAAETHFPSLGIPVGFSSPQTLTDFSTAVKKGCKGDINVLQPTVMAAVPLMLDRVRKSILTLVGPKGTFKRGLFDFAIKYKTFWLHKGFRTRMLDRLLLKRCHGIMGGKLNIIICGGAPLSSDTQNFICSCLNVKLLQGYGMTETAASATVMDVDDLSTGRIGAPLSTCKLRLVDWDEGGYHVTDIPNPRGEIVIGGDSVSQGYYKRDASTQECFIQENGIRWIHTGDIGEVFPNGTFKIIDRKKDLVKLQNGEYVALGKVEAELKTFSLIENICVTGNSLHNYVVALVVPNQQQLLNLATELKKTQMSFDKMCVDPDITAKATAEIRDHGRKCGLMRNELPAKVKLCSEEWCPENGLVTAALKLRRSALQQYYQQIIQKMYLTNTSNHTTKTY